MNQTGDAAHSDCIQAGPKPNAIRSAMSRVPFFICYVLTLSAATAVAQPDSATVTKTDAINAAAKTPAVTTRPFGVAPAGITSPELGEAVKAMDDASILPGQKNTITRLRWSDETVPKLWFAGLWGPKVDDALMAMTSRTPDLWSVELHEPHIDDDGMRSLAKLPKLRYLVVSPIERYVKPGFSSVMYCFPNFTSAPDRPRVTGKSIEAFANSATLESLELFDAVISSADLRSLPTIPKLSSVGLPSTIDDEAVNHLQACKRLSSLSLGYREITADEIERLAEWKTLRRLAITHATLSNAALESLAKLPNVDTLELIDCGLTDERLAHLRMPPKTATLLLGRNEIAGPGLAHLAGGNLKTLGLEFNNLDDDTIRHLPLLLGESRYGQLASGMSWNSGASACEYSWASGVSVGTNGFLISGVVAANMLNPSCDPAKVTCEQSTSHNNFGSFHVGGAYFAMSDAAVIWLDDSVSVTVLRALGNACDGEGRLP